MFFGAGIGAGPQNDGHFGFGLEPALAYNA